MAGWFLGDPAPPDAEVVVYCLPNAGGGASAFAGWHRVVPPGWWVRPVQLPGRENRIAEPPGFAEDELAEAISLDAGRHRFWLYGHSMGGVLAWEVARRTTAPGLRRLCVGASAPPHVPGDWTRRWAEADDEALLGEIAALGGIPAVVLEHPRTRRQLVRVLRSDLTWLARPRAADVVPTPITALTGTHDSLVPQDTSARWADLSPDVRAETVPGGHLFHVDDPGATVQALLTTAEPLRCA